jgi:hypothetical protein
LPEVDPNQSPLEHATSTNAPAAELPVRVSEPVIEPPQALREAPSEENETEEPIADTDAEPAEEVAPATSTDGHASEPSYVAAQVLREAFWFEHASAVESDGDAEQTTPEAPQADVREVELERRAVNSIPPPVSAQPSAEPTRPESVFQTERSRWVAALCLLLLIGLIVALTGRRPRHLSTS